MVPIQPVSTCVRHFRRFFCGEKRHHSEVSCWNTIPVTWYRTFDSRRRITCTVKCLVRAGQTSYRTFDSAAFPHPQCDEKQCEQQVLGPDETHHKAHGLRHWSQCRHVIQVVFQAHVLNSRFPGPDTRVHPRFSPLFVSSTFKRGDCETARPIFATRMYF